MAITSKQQDLVYTGLAKNRAVENRHSDAPKHPEPYVAPAQLVQAVNLALYLRRPLLLEGEAGCGKSRLARSVADELGLPFYPWYVRSTNKASEGLYEFDALLRLYDTQAVQALSASGKNGSAQRDPSDPSNYLRFGALGNAFQQRDRPAVVLIDEIDKADLDFPNDLLTVLDDPWEFKVPETGDTIQADKNCLPLVIITSNKEKGNLPAPFLRRCIYQFLTFPNTVEQLGEIVESHYVAQASDAKPSEELTRAAAARLIEIRNQGGLLKAPGTSEFLDWLEALRGFGEAPRIPKDIEAGPVPYPELLFKQRADFVAHSQAIAAP